MRAYVHGTHLEKESGDVFEAFDVGAPRLYPNHSNRILRRPVSALSWAAASIQILWNKLTIVCEITV